MLDQEGRVKLLDLGLARLSDGIHSTESPAAELTATGQPLGTADYIAPEQVSDSKSVSCAADVYSLGCTLYRMLSGRVPFGSQSHKTAFSKMTAHVSEAPTPLSSLAPSVPRPLAKLIGTMMDKQPAGRPTAEQVATELAKFSSAANLESLALSVRSGVPATAFANGGTQNATPHPAAFADRKTPPWLTAIACTAGGLLLGIIATIIVSIYRRDGSLVAQVKTEDGVRVSVEGPPQDSDSSLPLNEVGPAANPAPSVVLADDTTKPPPLVFALVAKIGDGPGATITAEQFDALQRELAKTDGTKRVSAEGCEFFPEGDVENLELAEAWTGGKRFIMLDTTEDCSIHWDEIAGHILNLETKQGAGGQNELLLTFDQTLSSRLEKLTGDHLGRHLAIASGGELIMAPIINSKISGKCAITGDWDTATFVQLQQTLAAAQLSSKPPSQANATSRELNIPAALDILANSAGKDIDQAAVASALEMLQPELAEKESKRVAAVFKSHDLLRSVQYLSGEPDEKSDWVRNAEQCAVYRLEVDWLRLFDALEGVVDELAGTDDVFQSVIAGIKLDPNGPQFDLLKVVENLSKHVFVLSDDARIAVAISVEDASLVKEAVDKTMNCSPDALVLARGSESAFMLMSRVYGPITTLVSDNCLLIGDPFLVRQAEAWINGKPYPKRKLNPDDDFEDLGDVNDPARR